jgi:hypothetical protein
MENSRLREAAPTSVNVTVGQRGREYLTDRKLVFILRLECPEQRGFGL